MEIRRPLLIRALKNLFEVHPVAGVLGPRQVGKTTLARFFAEQQFSSDAFFFDLENPSDLIRLQNPELAFSQISQRLIVIDEIQRRPELFPILRVWVDRVGNKHKFLILGTASRELLQQSSETLAGRIGYLEVTPFTIGEVVESKRLWLRGGFPRSYLAPDDSLSMLWRQNYIKTFLEQDIPNLGFQVPPQQLQRFWMMLAHYHGQILNASDLGRSLDVSYHTVKRYIDILAGTFMIRVLQPWFENISKRQVKSPKIYFRDSGIALALLNITREEELYRYPRVGALWEGFALEEIIRTTNAPDAFFWSTQAEAELDLFMVRHGKRIGFEFKYTDTPKITKSMRIALQDLKLDHLYFIMPGNQRFLLEERITVCGLDAVRELF